MRRTYVAPAAADHDEVAEVAASPECAREIAIFNAAVEDRMCIVRVDRIEPSKNLLRGLWAYRELLSSHPEWRNRVCLVAMCYPSRESLAEYQQLHHDVAEAADALNREFGTDEWVPVFLDTNDDFARSVAGLRRADVFLVNPIRDGLNLVAYEGPAINERDAVLVLSREAGACDELGPAGAIVVNPFDVVGTAEALHDALTFDEQERHARYENLRSVATARTPEEWLAKQIDAARASRASV
jgi:trehalose 6-phosphate synthase